MLSVETQRLSDQLTGIPETKDYVEDPSESMKRCFAEVEEIGDANSSNFRDRRPVSHDDDQSDITDKNKMIEPREHSSTALLRRHTDRLRPVDNLGVLIICMLPSKVFLHRRTSCGRGDR